MKRTGVILARLQPIHNGHLELIKKSMKENDETIIFVGSADKFNGRNPIPINLRMQMAKEAIEEMRENEKIYTYYKLGPLDDLSDESDNSHDWGFYLFSNVVKESGSDVFTIYYSDGFEIITTWFPPFILRNHVSLNLISRGAICNGISATAIRQMIVNGDMDCLRKYVPASVYEKQETLKEHINLAKLIK